MKILRLLVLGFWADFEDEHEHEDEVVDEFSKHALRQLQGPHGCRAVRSAGESDVLVIKFNPTRQVEWAQRFGGEAEDSGGAMAVSADGQVWVFGGFSDRITIGSTELVASPGDPWAWADFLAKLTPGGTVIWTRMLEHRTGEEPEEELATDRSGGCYLVGNFGGTFHLGGHVLASTDEFDDDVFLARFDADGEVLWARQFGDASKDYCDALTVVPDGNVFIAGASGDLDALDSPPRGFLYELAPDGTLVASLDLRTEEPEADVAFLALARTTDGALYAAGWYEGTLDVAGQTLLSSGDSDVLLVRVTSRHPPRLTVKQVGAKVQLSWPDTATDYALQRQGDLSVVGMWEDVPDTPIIEGGTCFLEIVPEGSAQFYRLARQE